MSQNYSLHFYLKKPKNYQKGPKFIYICISAGVDDMPKDASIGRKIEPDQWHIQAMPDTDVLFDRVAGKP